MLTEPRQRSNHLSEGTLVHAESAGRRRGRLSSQSCVCARALFLTPESVSRALPRAMSLGGIRLSSGALKSNAMSAGLGPVFSARLFRRDPPVYSRPIVLQHLFTDRRRRRESIGRCEAKQVGAPGQPFRDRRPSPQRIVGDRRSRPVSRYGRHFPRAVLFHLPSPKPQREKRSNEERTKPMDQSIPPSTFTAGGSLRHLANLYEGAT